MNHQQACSICANIGGIQSYKNKSRKLKNIFTKNGTSPLFKAFTKLFLYRLQIVRSSDVYFIGKKGLLLFCYKDSARRVENKISLLIFYPEISYQRVSGSSLTLTTSAANSRQRQLRSLAYFRGSKYCTVHLFNYSN